MAGTAFKAAKTAAAIGVRRILIESFMVEATLSD